MKIELARSAGFCMGVKRAIEMARKAARDEEGIVYTHGPLIHNPQELEKLKQDGILWIDEKKDAPGSVVIIRAHGVGPKIHERLGRTASKVLDATCPKVSAIQKRIHEYSQQGYSIVIAGDRDHPEVEGLLGFADGKAYVVSLPDEVDNLPELGKILLVAQTTQDALRYNDIKERVLKRFPHAEALHTICRATDERQSEVRRMLAQFDVIIVVGGKNSANTRRLYEICVEGKKPCYHIESAQELNLEELGRYSSIGVTAGASTPNWIIEEVMRTLNALCENP